MTSVQPHASFDRVDFLPGMTLRQYLDECQGRHPSLYARLDVRRLPLDSLVGIYDRLNAAVTPFDSEDKGGRGDAYRATQLKNPLIRARGIAQLIELAIPRDAQRGPGTCILDALGGNGTLARAARLMWAPEVCPTILTADTTAPMISDALAQGLPAIRQAVQHTLLRDGAVDAVMYAYGSHHIPPDEREAAVAEAHRVLRPGGRLVLHDFEVGSPTQRWYSELLDRYTRAGHVYEYFSRADMARLLTGAGFAGVRILDVYDPCVVYDNDPEAARIGLLHYLVSLFALDRLLPPDGTLDGAFWAMVEEVFRPYGTFTADELPDDVPTVRELTVVRDGGRFRAEWPRVGLVAVGDRP